MAKSSKTEFKLQLAENALDTVIGFNNSAKPLKDRTPEDLTLLMDMALNSNDKSLLQCFASIPTEAEWQSFKAAEFENNQPE